MREARELEAEDEEIEVLGNEDVGDGVDEVIMTEEDGDISLDE